MSNSPRTAGSSRFGSSDGTDTSDTSGDSGGSSPLSGIFGSSGGSSTRTGGSSRFDEFTGGSTSRSSGGSSRFESRPQTVSGTSTVGTAAAAPASARSAPGFDRDESPGAVSTAVGVGVEAVGDSLIGRSVGGGVDGLFGTEDRDGLADPLDATLQRGEAAWRSRVTDPLREADPDAVDPESTGLVRPFGISGEDVQDTAVRTSEFGNPAGFARDVLTAAELTGRAGQTAAEDGPEAIRRTGQAARAAPSAASTGLELVRENPRDAAIAGTALVATGGAAAAGARGARVGVSRSARAVDDATPSASVSRPSPSEVRTRAPDVSTRRDPTSGPLDVDPMLQQQVRDAFDVSPRQRLSGAVQSSRATQPAGDSLSDVFGTAGRRTDRSFASGFGTDLSDTWSRATDRVTVPAGDTASDIFGTAGRPGTPRVHLGESPIRSTFDRATRPAGDSASDIFGTAGAPGLGGQTPFASAGRSAFDRLTAPAGSGPSDVFGMAGAPGSAGATPFASSGRRAFDRATQPAGDTISDIFGTAGGTGRAGSRDNRLGSLFDDATAPAGDTMSDIFGTAPRAREGSILDTTLRIGPARPRRGTTIDADDAELRAGLFPDDADLPGGGTGPGRSDFDADVSSGASSGGTVTRQQRRSGDGATTRSDGRASASAARRDGSDAFGAGVAGTSAGFAALGDSDDMGSVGDLEPAPFEPTDTGSGDAIGEGSGIGADETGTGTSGVGTVVTTATGSAQGAVTGQPTATSLLGATETAAGMTTSTRTTTRTGSRRRPPRVPGIGPGGDTDEVDPWAFDEDDDVFGSGIADVDDLFGDDAEFRL